MPCTSSLHDVCDLRILRVKQTASNSSKVWSQVTRRCSMVFSTGQVGFAFPPFLGWRSPSQNVKRHHPDVAAAAPWCVCLASVAISYRLCLCPSLAGLETLPNTWLPCWMRPIAVWWGSLGWSFRSICPLRRVVWMRKMRWQQWLKPLIPCCRCWNSRMQMELCPGIIWKSCKTPPSEPNRACWNVPAAAAASTATPCHVWSGWTNECLPHRCSAKMAPAIVPWAWTPRWSMAVPGAGLSGSQRWFQGGQGLLSGDVDDPQGGAPNWSQPTGFGAPARRLATRGGAQTHHQRHESFTAWDMFATGACAICLTVSKWKHARWPFWGLSWGRDEWF